MDSEKQSSHRGPRLFDQKSAFCILIGFATFFAIFNVSCQTTPTSPLGVEASDLKLPAGYQPPSVKALTSIGTNSKPNLSQDGKKLVFISSLRPSHENAQAYLLDLEGGVEKRITFQDGEVAKIVFSADDSHVIYSSSTDEIKEDSVFVKESLQRLSGRAKSSDPADPTLFWKNQPLELYSSFLNGTRIERITHSPGYDSDPSVHRNGKKILFASARGSNIDLHMVSSTGTYLKPLTKSAQIESEPQFSPDGNQIIWVEYAPSMKESQIVLANKDGQIVQRLTSAPYIHWNPKWMPDGGSILFSSNRAGPENYEVYQFRIRDACLQRLTWHSGNDTQPIPSRDARSFYFSSDRSGKKQIYVSEIKPAQKCVN